MNWTNYVSNVHQRLRNKLLYPVVMKFLNLSMGLDKNSMYVVRKVVAWWGLIKTVVAVRYPNTQDSTSWSQETATTGYHTGRSHCWAESCTFYRMTSFTLWHGMLLSHLVLADQFQLNKVRLIEVLCIPFSRVFASASVDIYFDFFFFPFLLLSFFAKKSSRLSSSSGSDEISSSLFIFWIKSKTLLVCYNC